MQKAQHGHEDMKITVQSVLRSNSVSTQTAFFERAFEMKRCLGVLELKRFIVICKYILLSRVYLE